MRLVFKNYLVPHIQKLLDEAVQLDLPVEKIVVTQSEARQLEREMALPPIYGVRRHYLFGYPLEVEDGK